MANLVSAEQKKQYLNSWLEDKGIDHTLTQATALAKFEELAVANGWNEVYEVKPEIVKFEGEDLHFKMRFVGIISTRKADLYDYVVEDANDIDSFKAAKDADAQSRNYVNSAEIGHHWAYEYEGKKTTFKFSKAVNRLVVEKKISAAVALNVNKLTTEDLDGLSPNAMSILKLQMTLAAADKKLVAAGE